MALASAKYLAGIEHGVIVDCRSSRNSRVLQDHFEKIRMYIVYLLQAFFGIILHAS